MKRIIGFVFKNFKNFKGFPDRLRVKLMKDFFIEIRLSECMYSLVFANVKIGRYKLKEPILVLESKDEEEILKTLEKMLTNEVIFQRILKENLDKFRVIGNG